MGSQTAGGRQGRSRADEKASFVLILNVLRPRRLRPPFFTPVSMTELSWTGWARQYRNAGERDGHVIDIDSALLYYIMIF